MPKFKAVIERNHGIKDARGHRVNPFQFTKLLTNGPTGQIERRTWDDMEAESEAALRKFFEDAQAEGHESVAGFHIVSIERLPDEPSTDHPGAGNGAE